MVLYIDEVTPFYNSIALLSDAFRRIAGIKTPEEKIKEMQLELLKQQGKMGEYELKLAEQKIKRGEAEEERAKELFKLATQRAAVEIEAMKLTNEMNKLKIAAMGQLNELQTKEAEKRLEQLTNTIEFQKMMQPLLSEEEKEKLKSMKLQRKLTTEEIRRITKERAEKRGIMEGIKNMLLGKVKDETSGQWGRMEHQIFNEFQEKLKPYAYNISPDVLDVFTHQVKGNMISMLESLVQNKAGETLKHFGDIRATQLSILEAVRKSVAADVDASYKTISEISKIGKEYSLAFSNIEQLIGSIEPMQREIITREVDINIKPHVDNVKKVIEGNRISDVLLSFLRDLRTKYVHSDIFVNKVYPYFTKYIADKIVPLENKIIENLKFVSGLPNRITSLSIGDKQRKAELAALNAALKEMKVHMLEDLGQINTNISDIVGVLDSVNPLKSFIDYYIDNIVEQQINKTKGAKEILQSRFGIPASK